MNIIERILGYLGLRRYDSISDIQIEKAKHNGIVLDSITSTTATKQLRCNHQKGGYVKRLSSGPNSLVEFPLKGSSGQYAVIKHQHMHGDIWIECLRCGRRWKPPIRKEFKKDRDFYKAVEEYEGALNFPTNNSMSTSIQCRFMLNGSVDAGTEYVRRQLTAS